MKIHNLDVIQLLGKPVAEDSVQKLLQYVGIDSKKIKVKRGETDAAVDCPDKGLVFNFAEIDTDINTNLPEGTLVLSAVHAMAAGVEDNSQFGGELPSGLTFDLDRRTVAQRLGKPNWTSTILPNDRWNLGKYQLLVEFYDDPSAKVATVVVQLPR